jgi:hypothetical protein
MNVFNELHARGKFEMSLNAFFIALIPKKVEAVNIKNFRPMLIGATWVLMERRVEFC